MGVVGKADPHPRPRQTRTERRRQAQARRNRLILVIGVVASVAIVGAWFPVTELLHQRQQLAAASTQLHQLNVQNRVLHHQATQLETPAAVGRIAQQQYDLVLPGEQAYQVLPPSSSNGDGTLTTSPAGAPTSGAPGSKRSGTTGAARSRPGSAAGTPGAAGSTTGFLGRIVQALQFWR